MWRKECLAVVSFQLYTIYLRDKVLGDHTIDIELIWHKEEMREGKEEEDIDIEEHKKHLALVWKWRTVILQYYHMDEEKCMNFGMHDL